MRKEKKFRKIIIKDPRLRRLRGFLRYILYEAYMKESKRLHKKMNELMDQGKEWTHLYRESKELGISFKRSTIYCNLCFSIAGDRVYIPEYHCWRCINCYENKLPKAVHREWTPFIPFGKEQLSEYFRRLAKGLGRYYQEKVIEITPGPYGDSRVILTEMGVSPEDQEKFLKSLEEFGGFNDGEILMNARRDLERWFQTRAQEV
ncbi:MAG: hypothetical protein ACOC4M_11020 [Promethearchaeia archaeon]